MNRDLSIKIPLLQLNNEDFYILKANLVYLESLECRKLLSQSKITEEKKRITELFKQCLININGLSTERDNYIALM